MNGAVAPGDDATGQVEALRELIEETRRDINARLDALSAAVDRLSPAGAPTPAGNGTGDSRDVDQAIRAGDEVYVPRLGGTYTVMDVSPSGQEFMVQAGQARVKLRREELWALNGHVSTSGSRVEQERRRLDPSIGEIDLHGFTERDALVTLELFLHHAFAKHMPRVRVIHGKGNGILRDAVRRELARNPLVRLIEIGPQFRGDDGVTLVELDV